MGDMFFIIDQDDIVVKYVTKVSGVFTEYRANTDVFVFIVTLVNGESKFSFQTIETAKHYRKVLINLITKE